MSSTSCRQGAPAPAIPTASVSAMNILAATRAISGTAPAATRARCATILSMTGSCTGIAPHPSPLPASGERKSHVLVAPLKTLAPFTGRGCPRRMPRAGEGLFSLSSSQCCDGAHVRKRVEAKDRRAQFAGARGAENRLGERIEFGDEPLALPGDIAIRNARVMARLQNAAIGQRHLQLALGLRPAIAEIERELVA